VWRESRLVSGGGLTRGLVRGLLRGLDRDALPLALLWRERQTVCGKTEKKNVQRQTHETA
jgi:hypothetical protein